MKKKFCLYFVFKNKLYIGRKKEKKEKNFKREIILYYLF